MHLLQSSKVNFNFIPRFALNQCRLFSNMTQGIGLDPFALKNFACKDGIIECDPIEFTAKVNEHYAKVGEKGLVEGYAPFCKHIFVPNFVNNLPDSVLKITDANRSKLRCDYKARTEKELAVLTRWFEKGDVEAKQADWLDVILYSREQIDKENEATGDTPAAGDERTAWGIVAIKPQGIDSEIPMEPITMMRNALGKAEGGSGVPLDHAKYKASSDFWSAHARIS